MATSKQLLTFGKFKGQTLESTPEWYQRWLLQQPWFNKPKSEKPLHNQLVGWDGHSLKGQAVYDQIFEREMADAEKHDPSDRYGYYND